MFDWSQYKISKWPYLQEMRLFQESHCDFSVYLYFIILSNFHSVKFIFVFLFDFYLKLEPSFSINLKQDFVSFKNNHKKQAEYKILILKIYFLNFFFFIN